MPVWKIEPIASQADPAWLGEVVWREVLVRADTADEARMVGARLSEDDNQPPSAAGGKVVDGALHDPLRYRVVRLADAEAAARGFEVHGQQALLRVTVASASGEREDTWEVAGPDSTVLRGC